MLKSELFEILKSESFKTGDFVLKSGLHSNYYMDVRHTSMDSRGAVLIGEIFYEFLKVYHIQAIGGLATASIPLITSTLIAFEKHGRCMSGFWVRDEAKDHGTKKIIEGNLEKEYNVAIIDDVFTTGRSLKRVKETITNRVAIELVLVNRSTDRSIKSIFNIEDFLDKDRKNIV